MKGLKEYLQIFNIALSCQGTRVVNSNFCQHIGKSDSVGNGLPRQGPCQDENLTTTKTSPRRKPHNDEGLMTTKVFSRHHNDDANKTRTATRLELRQIEGTAKDTEDEEDEEIRLLVKEEEEEEEEEGEEEEDDEEEEEAVVEEDEEVDVEEVEDEEEEEEMFFLEGSARLQRPLVDDLLEAFVDLLELPPLQSALFCMKPLPLLTVDFEIEIVACFDCSLDCEDLPDSLTCEIFVEVLLCRDLVPAFVWPACAAPGICDCFDEG
ncbi:hypothetical protein FHG87_004324 [Trinorchestia longiramus]|nr:hypothetical protein FHG87_004324 [Trinorchestia longiramus]